MSTESFRQRLEKMHHTTRTSDAFNYVHVTLETSWALARDLFGDLARPEHAFEVYDRMTETHQMDSAYADDTDEECDHCGGLRGDHPIEHPHDGTCVEFVEVGEGCERCGNSEHAHVSSRLATCPGYIKS